MASFTSHSTAQTQQFAADFARHLRPGSVLALSGPLGAGKTTFIQSLAQALGIAKPVKSPTFNLIRSYDLPNSHIQFHHLDFYRIESARDLKSLDLAELTNQTNNILAIEWPEKIRPLLPPSTIWLNFKTTGQNTRIITTNFKL